MTTKGSLFGKYQDYDINAWDLADVTASSSSVFPNSFRTSKKAVGETFTIAEGTLPRLITVRDNDRFFNDGDLKQTLNSDVRLDGRLFTPKDGRITPEYSYVVRPVGSNDACDNITVYVFEFGKNKAAGFVSDKPLEPGTTYQIIKIDSNTPKVPYSDLATYPKVIPCFTPGTLITTPEGQRLVEDLQPGDKVLTRDNGVQEIRWIGRRDMTHAELAAMPRFRPVLIKAGSLGDGLPERDMLVSPNHRMLVASARNALHFGEAEILVSAKHLVDDLRVRVADTLGTSYLHFMFDRHQVVQANGVWTESFQPGDHSLGGMVSAQREELFDLFPAMRTAEGLRAYTAARKTLKRHEAALLIHG